MKNKPTPYLLALDWGTSSFRARVVTKEGELIEGLSTDQGIRESVGLFAEILIANLQKLQSYELGLPIVMSGMIGSRNGWYEAPYTQLPCDSNSAAQQLITFEAEGIGRLYLLPGIMKSGEHADVIRGEETEIIGAIEQLSLDNASMIIPGTHSKVVEIKNGQIYDFKTYLTGELFFAICSSTILGSFGNQVSPHSPWFKAGVIKGIETKHAGDLLQVLFTARSRVLVSDMPESESASFISGLLIGSEIGASAYSDGEVWILGNGTLPDAYKIALEIAGIDCQIVPENVVVQGALNIFHKYQKENL